MDTKSKILKESTNLFAIKGYDGVSMRDIANIVGIKGSSIYNHYSSKEEIFNKILLKYSKYVNNTFHNIVDVQDIKNIKEGSFDNYFVEQSINLFSFLLTDEYSVKLRKILTIEQFKNQNASKLFDNIYIDGALNYHKDYFKKLMDANLLLNTDPYVLALKFYSPVFLLYYKSNTLSTNDTLALKKHIIEFKSYYSTRG